jgi:hypothetical protein
MHCLKVSDARLAGSAACLTAFMDSLRTHFTAAEVYTDARTKMSAMLSDSTDCSTRLDALATSPRPSGARL